MTEFYNTIMNTPIWSSGTTGTSSTYLNSTTIAYNGTIVQDTFNAHALRRCKKCGEMNTPKGKRTCMNCGTPLELSEKMEEYHESGFGVGDRVRYIYNSIGDTSNAVIGMQGTVERIERDNIIVDLDALGSNFAFEPMELELVL